MLLTVNSNVFGVGSLRAFPIHQTVKCISMFNLQELQHGKQACVILTSLPLVKNGMPEEVGADALHL